MFYRGTVKSVLSHGLTSWFGGYSGQERKQSRKIIGAYLLSLEELYNQQCVRRATSIRTLITPLTTGSPSCLLEGGIGTSAIGLRKCWTAFSHNPLDWLTTWDPSQIDLCLNSFKLNETVLVCLDSIWVEEQFKSRHSQNGLWWRQTEIKTFAQRGNTVQFNIKNRQAAWAFSANPIMQNTSGYRRLLEYTVCSGWIVARWDCWAYTNKIAVSLCQRPPPTIVPWVCPIMCSLPKQNTHTSNFQTIPDLCDLLWKHPWINMLYCFQHFSNNPESQWPASSAMTLPKTY